MEKLGVAITGTRGFFGRALLLALEEDPQVGRILALDSKPPEFPLRKAVFERLDLVHPRSPERLAGLLREQRIDAAVHTAFLARPTHRGEWAHELEAIGTRHLLAALEATGVRKLVLRSTTLAYGALPSNPNYLPESAPLRGGRDSRFLADKVEAEEQATRFSMKHPERVVTLLRLAPVLGPAADALATIYLRRRFCPTLLGYDPLVQLVHQDDAVEAARLSLHQDVRGAINVAAEGVLPLSRAIELAGATRMPLPARALRRLSDALWSAQFGDFPPGLVDFLKYLCVADLGRMRSELAFAPRYTVQDAVSSFAGALRRAA